MNGAAPSGYYERLIAEARDLVRGENQTTPAFDASRYRTMIYMLLGSLEQRNEEYQALMRQLAALAKESTE